MPLSINVGLSRKASRDFQSAGCSINVTAELDQWLLAKPDELQRQIAGLYQQAEQSLDRQAGREPAADHYAGQGQEATAGNRHAAGNGNAKSAGSRPMTQSQRRAILAIARRAGADPEYEAREIIGGNLDELTVPQASELIDHLKGYRSSRDGRWT